MEKIQSRPGRGVEELINPNALKRAKEQLEQLGNYWIGPDVGIDKAVIMPPSSVAVDHVNLLVNERHLPPIDVTREMFALMNWSTRSCLAQVGIDVDFNALSITDKMIRDIKEGKDVLLPVWIRNHCHRPVAIEGKVARFFWTNEANRLRGDALRETINSGAFKIAEDGWTVNERGSCIKIPLKHRFYIPGSSEVVKIKGKEDLPKILQELPGDQDADFKIGETAAVSLGSGIVGVINCGMYKGDQANSHSPLIDPGWNASIRTETRLDFIELLVFKK
jgi:hypothetical protein